MQEVAPLHETIFVAKYTAHKKGYEHQHQRKTRGKHQIRRPRSRESNIVGGWNFQWLYITHAPK